MFSSSCEPPLDPRQQFSTEYFHQQQQPHQPSLPEEFYCPSNGFQPPPPPLIHYPGNHHPPPPPPLLPHEQDNMVGYSCQQQQQQQQQQHPSYDFAYCETQWTAYYDGGQQRNQYEAYCVREAYRFSAIQPSDCSNPHPPTALPTPTPPLTRHQHQLQIQQQQERGGANKLLSHTAPGCAPLPLPPGGALLNSICGPKPIQLDGRMPGRHPHPPSGNNSKLKHKCPFDGCPWRFATPYKLRRHIKSHTKETPFVCKECGRGFSVRYNLLMHIQTIHSQPQKFKCPMPGCKEAFHTQPRLNGHLRRVHKKDWKTMQLPKPETESKQTASGEGGGGSRSSSTSSDDSVDTAPKTQSRFECVQCHSVFSSQAKLTSHSESHSTQKSFKCTVQGCNKAFPTKEKLAKHTEIHKQQPKQFCCPHENCNRVFLRQSHLKNHLKIHAHNYFVCPVMDCNEKFSSEADYNVHLNTHMNYRHKCQVAGCGHAFLTRKRLELHCRVMHGVELQSHQSLLPVVLGHGTPLIPPPHSQHQPHSPPSNHSPLLAPGSTCPLTHSDSNGGNNFLNMEDGIREVDLPGLSPDEIETILSENSHWTSGEQFKNFFHSAVELSEMEAKLFSASGYESDSGYSTYDVSPITSSAPLQFGGCRPEVSTGYRSISPALTPVNPSTYISLSSSNPFQFGAGGHPPMHMSLHSTTNSGNGGTGHTPTTPLPPSATSPDGDFAFFPPATPSYHHHPTGPAIISPTRETAAYMIPGGHNGFPMPPTTPQQHQREFRLTQFPTAGVLPELRQQQQPELYDIDFPDILNETSTAGSHCQCSGGEATQLVLAPPPLLPSQTSPVSEVKMEIEHKSCPNGNQTGNTSPCWQALTPTTSPTAPYPNTSSIKLEILPEAAQVSCNMNSQSTSQTNNFTNGGSQHLNTTLPNSKPAAVSSDAHLQAFLASCSELPPLRELVTSDLHPTVVVVAVSTALVAVLGDQTQQVCLHEMKVKEGPYDIPRLHSLVTSLTPQQLEKLGTPDLVSTARCLATQHLEGLAAARRRQKETNAASTTTSPSSSSKSKFSHKTTGNSNGIIVQSKTSVKTSITVKTYSSKHKSVGRVGAGSDMKTGHKKKTQWPRSMNKANLLAFREHILNKLKRGQEEGQRPMSVSQESSPSHVSGVISPGYDMDSNGGGVDPDVPTQVRCSSEPADFFSYQMSSRDLLSPSQLNTSHSAGNVSLKHFNSVGYGSPSPEALHPDLNPDILLSSSVLGLPDSILGDMEIDSLTSLSSPSEQDFVQFLYDPSPPTSVTSPLDNMQDLDSIQDLLSVTSEDISAAAHFGEATAPPTSSPSPSSTPSATAHHSFFSPTSSSPVCTSVPQLGQQDTYSFANTITTTTSTSSSSSSGHQPVGAVPPPCSTMADVASLFNESINSIASVESLPTEPNTAAVVPLEDSLESVFQRSTDPLLPCGSRYTLTGRQF